MNKYEENLAFLREIWPDRIMVSLPEIAKALGGRSPEHLRADPRLQKTKYGKQQRVTLTSLARYMCL